MCCSVLQCVAVCCSVLHKSAMDITDVYLQLLRCVAVCCSVLQCVAVCCSVLHKSAMDITDVYLQLLRTSTRFLDTENTFGQCFGDQINLSGVSIKLKLELHERYSDVTFRIFVVHAAKGDVPLPGTLWNGASVN